MIRRIGHYLGEWAQSQKRNVLLLRGARQVGKTYAARSLGKRFEHFVELNLEKEKDAHAFFQGSLDAKRICEKVSLFAKRPVQPGRTLLFFDEIQACPEAIQALRFFHEEMPDLHVIAAGSLLEFVLSEIPSFGVGRISSLFMFPMSFREFLAAIDEAGLADLLSPASPQLPVDDPFHRRLVDAMRIHMLIGGMPAVVEAYRSTRDALACLHILDDVLSTLYDDFAKYKKRAPVIRLRETFESISRQAGGKFVYAQAAAGNPTSGYKDALELLSRAHLTHRVYHTAAHGLPLGAEIDTRTFKALPFDTGIHLRLLGLDIRSIIAGEKERLVNEGSVAEVYAGIELIAGQSPRLHPQLHYWHRELPGSNAEVDYVVARQGTIHGIEVKAGTRGQMQSLHRFLDEHAGARGIRASLENFSSAGRFDIIPLYAAGAFLGET